MIKFKLLTLALILLGTAVAHAKVTPITEWEDKLPYSGEQKPAETSCAAACPGFDLTTLICPQGEKLDDCKEPGCSYYHRCINQ